MNTTTLEGTDHEVDFQEFEEGIAEESQQFNRQLDITAKSYGDYEQEFQPA